MIGGFTFFSLLSMIFPPKDGRIHKEYDWSNERDAILDGHEVSDEEKARQFSEMKGVGDTIKESGRE